MPALTMENKMKKYITLVFEYETDEELQIVRDASAKENCRAWSMDHEMLRVDLMRQAIEDNDLGNAARYGDFDGVIALRDELRGA